LKAMWADGKITAESEFSIDNDGYWAPLVDIIELLEESKAGSVFRTASPVPTMQPEGWSPPSCGAVRPSFPGGGLPPSGHAQRRREPNTSQKESTPGIPKCQLCGEPMKRTVVSSGNCAGIVFALIVFCIGILIFAIIPLFGWVIGPIVSIGALFMGGSRSKVWKCANCGSIGNRA